MKNKFSPRMTLFDDWVYNYDLGKIFYFVVKIVTKKAFCRRKQNGETLYIFVELTFVVSEKFMFVIFISISDTKKVKSRFLTHIFPWWNFFTKFCCQRRFLTEWIYLVLFLKKKIKFGPKIPKYLFISLNWR